MFSAIRIYGIRRHKMPGLSYKLYQRHLSSGPHYLTRVEPLEGGQDAVEGFVACKERSSAIFIGEDRVAGT